MDVLSTSTFRYNPENDLNLATMSLKDISTCNKQVCELLCKNGYNGSIFHKNVRKQSKSLKPRLDPASSTAEERVNALTNNGLSLSSIFHTIGPTSVSTDEIFQSFEYQHRQDKYKENVKLQKKHNAMFNTQQLALEAIRKWTESFVLVSEQLQTDGFTAMTKVGQKTPNATDIKRILKWKLGNEKYKETVKAEGDEKKPTLDRLYLRFASLLFPNVVTFNKFNFSDVSPNNILRNMRHAID